MAGRISARDLHQMAVYTAKVWACRPQLIRSGAGHLSQKLTATLWPDVGYLERSAFLHSWQQPGHPFIYHVIREPGFHVTQDIYQTAEIIVQIPAGKPSFDNSPTKILDCSNPTIIRPFMNHIRFGVLSSSLSSSRSLHPWLFLPASSIKPQTHGLSYQAPASVINPPPVSSAKHKAKLPIASTRKPPRQVPAELAPGECLVKIVHRGSSHMWTTSHPFPRASTPMPPQVSSRAYRTVKYSNTSTGNWIVIPGAGGGLAVAYLRTSGMLMAVGLADHAMLNMSIIWWYS
ncbi:hypothetical protein B0H17DRAFT_1255064 [Mycena rosella]|uniref:Uncharacterized protein n=1 Tax=Mycena rosella TaxID=1033263 RepID=A0AAD7CV85_MYCRO|nr:hypothetical protein B0H17DRAFT_1255064 [Mycena rosella]